MHQDRKDHQDELRREPLSTRVDRVDSLDFDSDDGQSRSRKAHRIKAILESEMNLGDLDKLGTEFYYELSDMSSS